jgi:hypothetical protein
MTGVTPRRRQEPNARSSLPNHEPAFAVKLFSERVFALAKAGWYLPEQNVRSGVGSPSSRRPVRHRPAPSGNVAGRSFTVIARGRPGLDDI